MASPTVARKQFPTVPLVIGAVAVVIGIAALVYLSRPAPKPADEGPSAEAKAYLPNLQLSDVNMQASENLMQQRVVEIQGHITNKGPRTIHRIEVECIFDGVNHQSIYRERVPIVSADLAPNQTRQFRLPFDSLPDAWNQAMPHLVIAQIQFGG
jgi:hypothetical protein